VGLGAKEEGEHEEHKDVYAYLETKEMAPFRGWENIPYALLKMLVDSPYLYDLMKHDLLKWEFQGKKKQYTESRYLGAMAGFAGEFVRLQQSRGEAVTSFYSSWLGPEDFQGLMDLLPEDRRYTNIKEEEEAKKKAKQKGYPKVKAEDE